MTENETHNWLGTTAHKVEVTSLNLPFPLPLGPALLYKKKNSKT